jgi:hypothetical protein
VAVDTVTDDLLLTNEGDVARYEELFLRLREASLPMQDSLELLIEVAQSRTH